MGMIRADGDIIRAINAMTDLNDMVRKYINIHRRDFCDGVHVRIVTNRRNNFITHFFIPFK